MIPAALLISQPPPINHQNQTTMTDILYTLAAIGFFALMLAFIAGCEKI